MLSVFGVLMLCDVLMFVVMCVFIVWCLWCFYEMLYVVVMWLSVV